MQRSSDAPLLGRDEAGGRAGGAAVMRLSRRSYAAELEPVQRQTPLAGLWQGLESGLRQRSGGGVRSASRLASDRSLKLCMQIARCCQLPHGCGRIA